MFTGEEGGGRNERVVPYVLTDKTREILRIVKAKFLVVKGVTDKQKEVFKIVLI